MPVHDTTDATDATADAISEVLREAALALHEYEALRKALRHADARLQSLCRRYDSAAGLWGFQAHHLRRACEARGLLP